MDKFMLLITPENPILVVMAHLAMPVTLILVVLDQIIAFQVIVAQVQTTQAPTMPVAREQTTAPQALVARVQTTALQIPVALKQQITVLNGIGF